MDMVIARTEAELTSRFRRRSYRRTPTASDHRDREGAITRLAPTSRSARPAPSTAAIHATTKTLPTVRPEGVERDRVERRGESFARGDRSAPR